jgi:hypothetical protein
MEPNYVGIIVNTSLHKGIPSGKTRHEIIPYYEEAGSFYGLVPCFFRLHDITKNNQVPAYIKGTNGYKKRWITVPKVIHNRSIYQKKHLEKRILQLEREGKQIFNHWNRYGKLQIYDILMKDVSLRPHLPCTVPASLSSAKQLMSMYDSLIIKPDKGSIGRGIVKISRTDSGWRLSYPKDKWGRLWGSLPFKKQLPNLLKRKFRTQAYVIQQLLPLALYKGSPFDLRVSVQRDHSGEWQITGIAGKVAAKNKFITNVAQGGKVYSLEMLLKEFPHLDPIQIKEDIHRFSIQVAAHLSRHLPHLADIGLDVGITEHGFPVFIECNNRDLRYSFSKGKMMEEWKASYSNPIGYALYLLKGGK